MSARNKLVARLALLSLLLVGLGSNVQAERRPKPSDGALIARLHQEAGGRERIARHAETGKVRFIGVDPQHAIPRAAGLAASASPERAARAFLETYGQLFGLRDQSQELMLRRAEAQPGRSFVRFQQVYQDIPVLAGELVVQLDQGRNVLSAGGEILPDLPLRVAPALDKAAASTRALAAVAKYRRLRPADLRATQPQLWLYNPALLGGPGLRRTSLTWRMEVAGHSPGGAIRELVLVDAQTGAIALHFNQIAEAKERHVCNDDNAVDLDNDEANNCPPESYVRSEGQAPTGVGDVDLAYDYSGDTYDYYNNFGRDSLDGKGLPLISLVKYCDAYVFDDCPFQNSFWDGQQVTFGEGFASVDDVVGHELTHGFTEFTSGLFYYYQSGAINESLSDVFGELIDQSNGKGTDTPAVRWQLGEDLPGGPSRDMQDPAIFGDPDRTGSGNYYGGAADNGGVHINSGVNNKAAYLMADGGSFNGYTIAGLGAAKVGWIYYTTSAYLLTSGSDYQDLGDALNAACAALVGSHGITQANCAEVAKVVSATEMGLTPANAAAPEAPICTTGAPDDRFYDDMEDPASANWASAGLGANEWFYPQASYAASGRYAIYGYDQEGIADYTISMTGSVLLPANAYLHFRHAYSFDYGTDLDSQVKAFDGGVVEYSTDGGASWSDAGPLFTENGYNVTIASDHGNPLGGRQAFSSASNGYYSSRADLSTLAGQNVRFRFRIGTDDAIDGFGWFIDDVRIYTCTASNIAPRITITNSMSVFQAAAAVTANIGRVSDAQDAAGSLALAASGAPAGMTASLKNIGGLVFATVSAGCTVAPGTYAISVAATDSGTLTAAKAFTVEVLSAGQRVQDPSLEGGTPSHFWGEGSTNFATPLCNLSDCDDGGGTAAPRSGSWWLWFGGTSKAENGYVTQMVSLPAGPASLDFYLWIGQHNGTGSASYVRVLIDGAEVFRASDASTAYNSGYTHVGVDVSAFGDGARTLRIEEHNPASADAFNVSIDDVTLTTDNNVCTPLATVRLTSSAVSVDEDAATVDLTVRLDAPFGKTVSVGYATTDGTAAAGKDYTAKSGTLTFSPGTTTRTISVPILDDTAAEQDERFKISLSSLSNAALGTPSSVTVTIKASDIPHKVYLPVLVRP